MLGVSFPSPNEPASQPARTGEKDRATSRSSEEKYNHWILEIDRYLIKRHVSLDCPVIGGQEAAREASIIVHLS